MPLNSLDYVTKFTDELDKKFVQPSIAAMFIDNAFGAKFVGAKTVSIPDVDFSGLGDYDRDTGFPLGSITVDQKTYTLTKERARSFNFDRMDMDEVGISELAGSVMSEFIRTKVAPEVDAYSFSKLAGIATTKSHTVSGTMANGCVAILNEAINKVQEVVGYDEGLVALVDSSFYAALMSTSELNRSLDIGDFSKGGIDTKVQMYNGVAIIPVPTARMFTAYDYNDGVTAGQTAGGFAPDDEADHIGCIVLPKSAAKLVKKHDKVRTFTPDENQSLDAYRFDYRLYYDLLVKNSAADSIYVFTYSDTPAAETTSPEAETTTPEVNGGSDNAGSDNAGGGAEGGAEGGQE